MNFVDGFVQKKGYRVTRSSDTDYVRNLGCGDTSTMLNFAMANAKLRLNEAMAVFQILYHDGNGKIVSLVNVLRRLESPDDARALIAKLIRGEDQVVQMKAALGQAYAPMIGLFNGFYMLDLAKETDRLCLQKLVIHSQTALHAIRESNAAILGSSAVVGVNHPNHTFGDTSQKENWSCFRNEIYRGNPYVITSADLEDMKKEGKLSFDFSTVARPKQSQKEIGNNEDFGVVVSDRRFVNLMMRKLKLINWKNVDSALIKLQQWKLELCMSNLETTSESLFECDRKFSMVSP